MSEGRGMGLLEMMRKLQVVKTIDAILAAQYEEEEGAKHRRELDENMRSGEWHQSFHASSFPLDPDVSCPRKALYSMMALPGSSPVSRYGRAIMESGEHVEEMIVRRLKNAGVLLSENEGNGRQTNFRHSGFWLTGFVDAIINLNGVVHVVEIKSKKHQHVDEMLQGKRGYDVQHRAQAMTYVWFARMAHEQLGFADMGLEPCSSASILYVSRDAPGVTAEFWLDFDEAEFNEGLERLKIWREAFISGELPPRPPFPGWSKAPCQYCDYKPSCKEDDKAGVSRLEESSAVDYACLVYGRYDFKSVQEGVVKSWEL